MPVHRAAGGAAARTPADGSLDGTPVAVSPNGWEPRRDACGGEIRNRRPPDARRQPGSVPERSATSVAAAARASTGKIACAGTR
ncbi:hypothetical protein GCM10014719_12550 [Planomonospora parontospora subsp. antibiotica]|nr:hypothetical protein GCM10014719_12550 [Planomonospora parontospora subsp. antibiotica]GII14080.1 hypothetical protein Ppa05_08060 [Planomonospora parontospora subsp. antibiotica]